MSEPRIYLDHAATTPVLTEARAAMIAGIERWANPSSPHSDGRSARAALEEARRQIAGALNWDGEVILTSGASEAIALAMLAGKADSWIVNPTEHDAVQRLTARIPAGRSLMRLAVDLDGRLVMASLARALETCGGRPMVACRAKARETPTRRPPTARARSTMSTASSTSR